ncbi:MAG: hypothetical protein J7K26_02095 [Candidatus Aenigmarchaeota archaeon]|nr:hypothetical protein [Candidatus Aenigmarchaeota archaeon]
MSNTMCYLKKLYYALGGDSYYTGPSAEEISKKLGLDHIPTSKEVLEMMRKEYDSNKNV